MIDFETAELIFRQAAEEGRDYLTYDEAQRAIEAGYREDHHNRHIGRWRRILECENCVGKAEDRAKLEKQLASAEKKLATEKPKLEQAIREAQQALAELEKPVEMLSRRQQAIEDHKAQLRAHVPPAVKDKHNRMKRIIKGSLAEELHAKRGEVNQVRSLLVDVPQSDSENIIYFERLRRYDPSLVVSKTDAGRVTRYFHSQKWPEVKAALEADLPAMEAEVEELEQQLDQALTENDRLLDWHLERLG